jgi:DNA-binding NtrC family response regulator
VEAVARVLLVEDEAPLRRSLTKFLERAGYAFDSCATVRDALVHAQSDVYDILITEYRLPDANGTELLEELKRTLPDITSIIIAEYDHQAVSEALNRVGVGSYLKKPFDVVELESALLSAGSKPAVSFRNFDWTQALNFDDVPASIRARELSEY